MPTPTHVRDIFPPSCEQLQSTGNGHAFWLIKGDVIIKLLQMFPFHMLFPPILGTYFLYSQISCIYSSS